MNAAIGVGLYIILFIIGIFILICGLMTAFIIPSYMHLTGWNWIFVFISTLSVIVGSGGGSIVTIVR